MIVNKHFKDPPKKSLTCNTKFQIWILGQITARAYKQNLKISTSFLLLMQQKNYFRIHDIIIKVFSYKQLYKTINFSKIEVCGKSIKLLSASPQLCKVMIIHMKMTLLCI